MANSMSKRSSKEKITRMVRIAVLIAIILLLNFTPIGFLRIGPVDITFLQIPVIIGAIMIGPAAGAFLGLVFGLLSLSKAPVSPLFAPVFSTDPVLVALVCIVPRVLMGWLTALLYKALSKSKVNSVVSYIISGFTGSVLNTMLFIGGVIVVLGKFIEGTMADLGLITEKTLTAFWVGVGLTNGIPEAIATSIIVAAICKALSVIDKQRIKKL